MRKATARILLSLLLVAAALAAAYWGVALRRQLFEWSMPIHHTDVWSGFSRGRIIQQTGVLDVYDKIAGGDVYEDRYGIDYAPLRLCAVAAWAAWFGEHHPGERWNGSYEHTWPMLAGNTAAELLSSVLAFLLVRLWWIRSHDSTPNASLRANLVGFVAALLFWFNPAILCNAHCWPQWDVWLIPFFLGAVLLASVDQWFAAGTCVIVGAFFKGQILLVAPMFILWPLFRRRPWPAIRFVCGAVMATALVASPWITRAWTRDDSPNDAGIAWLVATSALLIVINFSRWGRHSCPPSTGILARRILPPGDSRGKESPRVPDKNVCPTTKPAQLIRIGRVVAVLLLAWPWTSDASMFWKFVAMTPVVVALTLTVARARWRVRLPIYAMLVGFLVLLLMPVFGASGTWFTVGFEYGSRKFPTLASAPGTYSIPTLLRDVFHWPDDMNSPAFQLPGSTRAISTRLLMLSLYGVCLVLCSFGAAMHDRRRDPRFLVAVVAPWLCFFALLTQMNNRYLVWAAGLSALLIGVDVGLALLSLVVSLICVTGMLQHMLPMDRDFAPAVLRAIEPMKIHLAWPVALAAAVYLYLAVKPSKRRTVARIDEEPTAAETSRSPDSLSDDERIPLAVN